MMGLNYDLNVHTSPEISIIRKLLEAQPVLRQSVGFADPTPDT